MLLKKLFNSLKNSNVRVKIPKYEEKLLYNKTLCNNCKGYCCKQFACHFSPYDFEEMSYKYLKEEILKGHISIDKSFGIYFLRIRNKNAQIVDTGKISSGDGCILLTKNGCIFSDEKRPRGGRELIPQKDKQGRYNCYQYYSIEKCEAEWEGCQIIMKKLLNKFESKKYNDYPCYYLEKNGNK